ncbi:putative lipid II flippase FtsW [Candidatus Parcubacteria bacterium]|nr:putative lipid II flippase FtsW [Candidatus Parcubacteria bacterium]
MKRHLNYYFLALASFLIVFGLLFLSMLSAIASLQNFGTANYYLFHQLLAIGIGLVAGVVVFKIPLAFWEKAAPWLFLMNAVALLLVFLPVLGLNMKGASRWLNIGGASLQPSEFFKITAILYASAWISQRFEGSARKTWQDKLKKGYGEAIKGYLPFIIFLGIIGILFYLQRDISTLGIIVVSLLAIYFTAKTPLWHTILSFGGGIGVALLLIIKEPYRFERLLVFLHPDSDPLGRGLQLKQSLIALGSGGLWGKGLGMSVQKFGFLPEAMSDSIFAIIGEETGIIGCAILISLFLLFLYLGFKIAHSANNNFAKLAAVGLTTWIVFQACINVASACGLFPLAGIPLPFFSYGGSHLIAEIIAVGLLLNISKNG